MEKTGKEIKTGKLIQAKQHKIMVCHICSKPNRINPKAPGFKQRCTRCNSKIYYRKKESIVRTWAFLIGAAIFYIPANTYSFMFYSNLGQIEGDTILSGVEELINADLWPLALLVFTASIFVPIAKIAGLGFLLLSAQLKWNLNFIEKTKMYKIVDIIGRWSMLDVFLVSLMTGLVKLGQIADVEPGPGVRYFTAVVILTLLAAMSFDPRLIWDNHDDYNTRNE